jgi:hypothetical protein
MINTTLLPVVAGIMFLVGYQQGPAPVFQAQTIDTNLQIGYGLALADVDGDGKTDVLLADKKQFAWYRNGDWKKFVMIENLTTFDNVCIAARDVDGDGKCEVAVGAQWNPSETSDTAKSGSVHFLVRPANPTQPWTAIELHHEPTVHRMRWVKASNGTFFLVVAPLHGRGNTGGTGQGSKILAYQYAANPRQTWRIDTIENSMHLTHNLEPRESGNGNNTGLYLAGKEGISFISNNFSKALGTGKILPGLQQGAGEIRMGSLSRGNNFLTTIEPMHGTEVVVYLTQPSTRRIVLDDDVKEGHALAAADFLGNGTDQVAAGWRLPNKSGKVGIKLYYKTDNSGTRWQSSWIDENTMACEDLQVADLDRDGKPDIVASGRATKNLKIYWNKTASSKR